MTVDFNEIINRTATDSIKWGARESLFKNKDAIPMWVADMDFKAPEAVIDALRARVEHGVYGYGDLPDEYFATVQRWLHHRHNWNVEQTWLLHSPGVLAGISFVLDVVTDQGGKVIIQPPVYHPFKQIVQNSDRTLVNNPLRLVNGRYEIDFDDLERKLKDGAQALILCSPHNPVGRVWSRDELIRVGQLCKQYGTFVISDEIHSDLILQGHKHTPFASLGDAYADNCVMFVAPSKTFNLAGFHAAIAVIPNEKLRDAYTKALQKYHVSRPDILGKVALQTAYSSGEPWLEALLEYIESNRVYLTNYIEENIPEIRVTRAEGTYLVWLDCRGLGLSHDDLKEFMIHKAGIAMNEGSMFGEGGSGFMRMNVACPQATIAQALKQLHEAVKSLV